MDPLTRKRKLDAAHDDPQSPVPAPAPDPLPAPKPKRPRLALPASEPTPAPSRRPSPAKSPPPPALPVPPPPPSTTVHPHYSLHRRISPPASLLSPQADSPVSPAAQPPRPPPLFPPISRATLRELDLDAILRNPQLRHDLLFDPGLQFRPTSGRRKLLAAESYWDAVLRELEHPPTSPDPLSCDCASSCSTRRPPTPPPWSPRCYAAYLDVPPVEDHQPALRIPFLLREFVAVLSSVIVPPPLAAVAPPASADARALLAHLDPELITQELRRHIFDPAGLFTLVGATLKRHCAPMRDRLVDAMVCCATGQGEHSVESPTFRAARTIRLCFEILELMKLDIANHQLQHLRPFLAASTPEFELRIFLDQCRRRGGTIPALTRSWLQRTWAVLPPLSVPTPLPRRTRIHTAFIHALTDLVFTPAPLPETLALDAARVALLEKDAADLAALYMLLLLWRQLAFAQRGGTGRLAAWEADRVKREIWEIGPRRLGACFLEDVAQGPGEQERWEHAMEGVALQIARRAEEGGGGDPRPGGEDAGAKPPSEDALALMRGWIGSHLRCGSPLAARLRTLLRDEVVRASMRLTFGSSAVDGESKTEKAGGAYAGSVGDGLEPLQPEIRHLAGRVARLAGVNMRVYWGLYAADGFLCEDSDPPPTQRGGS